MSLSIAQNTLMKSACLLLCAIPSIIVVVTLQNGVIGDGPEYHQIAVNVLQRHVFSEAYGIPYEPTVFRSLGYPVFLAAIYAITSQSTGPSGWSSYCCSGFPRGARTDCRSTLFASGRFHRYLSDAALFAAGLVRADSHDGTSLRVSPHLGALVVLVA